VQRVAGRRVGRRRRGRLRLLVGQRQDGPRPARALELVEAGVGGDAEEPGLDGGAALEARAPAPGAQERLLDGVLGVGGRAEHAVAVQQQGAAERLHDVVEGALVAGEGRGGGDRHVIPWTPPAREIHR
jgi:hypothetical protein